MKQTLNVATVAFGAAMIVATGTVVGSSKSLYAIGEHVYPAAPWALPLAIDMTGLVAGLAVKAKREDTFATWTLRGMTLFSALLQWYETGNPIAMAVVFGAYLSFELAMRLVPASMDVAPAKHMTRAQEVRALAAELNIKGRSKMTVDQLEAAIYNTGKGKGRGKVKLVA